MLLACAALWFERAARTGRRSGVSAGTLPHFAYHLTTTDSFEPPTTSASLGAFALEMAVVVAAMVAVISPDRERSIDGTTLHPPSPTDSTSSAATPTAPPKKMYGRPTEPALLIAHHRPLLIGYGVAV